MAITITLLCCSNTLFAQSSNLLTVERQRYDAMIAQDTNALAAMLAHSLQYIHSNGMVDTKQSLLQSIATKTLVHKSITTSKVCTRIYQRKFAIITGEAVYDINYKNMDMVLHFVYTNVYRKFRGHWILINRQTSPLNKS
jgi:hypothetical protein